MINKIDYGNEKIVITQDIDGAYIKYYPSFLTSESIKIKQAILKIPAEVNAQNITFDVENVVVENEEEKSFIIDSFQKQSKNNLICIDISDELQDLLSLKRDMIILRIKNATQANISFFDGAEVLINYSNKKALMTSNDYDINCKRAGHGLLNLSTGALSFRHSDLVNRQNALPIEINHIYNSFLANLENDSVDFDNKVINIPDFNCGKGWKLNIQQYLVKENGINSLLSDGKSANKFTYINADGKHEEFLERFKYHDSENNLCFASASMIHIDQDGKMTYLDERGVIRKVEREIATNSNLSLSSRYEDFKGLSLIEQDVEEISNLKSEVEDLKFTIKSIEKNIAETNENINLSNSSYIISQKNQSIQKSSLENEEISLTNESNLKDKKKEYTRISREYRNLYDTRIYDIIESQQLEKEMQSKLLLNDISDEIEDINNAISEKILKNKSELLNANKSLYTKNNEYLDEQNKFQNEQLKNNLDNLNYQLDQYNKSLIKKEHQLSKLERQIPVHYLTNDDGVTLGFGKTSNENIYRLVLVADNYENAIYINYNDNNEIENIKTSNSELISFSYENNKLISITDVAGRKIAFEYEDSLLSRAIYPNGQISKFEYQEGKLTTIESPSGYGVSLKYSQERIIKIDEITTSTLITKEKKESSNDPIVNDSIEINYYDIRSTILTNNKTKKKLTYVFDTMG